MWFGRLYLIGFVLLLPPGDEQTAFPAHLFYGKPQGMGRNVSKKSGARRERNWTGPVWLSLGFRPFFLLGPVFAALALGNWLFLLNGSGIEPSALSALDWHIHEMLFGYPSAAIAGFLLTAVPNWTGRLPVQGPPLLGLVAVWGAGRIAMVLPVGASPAAMVLDMLFLPCLAFVIGREVIVGKNWRNLRVLLALSILAGANIWFHSAVILGLETQAPVRLGFSAILLLIMLIGGRVTPSFTRNWLARQAPGKLPTPFNWFDGLVLAVSAVALLGWVGVGQGRMIASFFFFAGVLHVMRLLRWAGYRCLTNPLLFVLHVFYGFVPLGLLALGIALAQDNSGMLTAGLHLFGIGAIGGMTLAVSLRASLGHTGRALQSDRAMNLMMVLVGLSALTRAGAAIWPHIEGLITLSGVGFIAAFGLFVFRVGPWLWTPRKGA